MPDTQIKDEKLPLPYEDAVHFFEQFKDKATEQFLALWRTHSDRMDTDLKWGEEIEYMLVDFEGGVAKAALVADQVLRSLGSETGEGPVNGAGWRTEYGNMMVEGVTHPPFAASLNDILLIEPALKWRRDHLAAAVKKIRPSAEVLTITAFPLLGVEGFTFPATTPSPDGVLSKSILCPDQVTSPHPRYQAFTANFRKRKGCKVGAFIPVDGIAETDRLSADEIARLPEQVQAGTARDPVPGHIYMDSQAFGAGQCCTQATFLAATVEDARHLTDQFLVLAPIFLALTAATPFLRGCVADSDTRWQTFQQTWDDRRPEELATVRNSRTSANDFYIGSSLLNSKEEADAMNDVELPVRSETAERLQAEGVDELMSRHIAHVLIRDPVLVFQDRLAVSDKETSEHFEHLQGTNWGTVRFKPPGPETSSIGWRVEFRSPEVQVTDFENAAIVALLRVLAQVIVEEKLDLRIPISKCDANDTIACTRSAASTRSFWFRDGASGACREMALSEILGHKEHGIFSKCRAWLDAAVAAGTCLQETRGRLEKYMLLFERRAAGILPTPATFLRSWLRRHESFLEGGVAVPPDFVYEMCLFAAGKSPSQAALMTELLGDLC